MRAALIGAGEESLHTIQKAQELGVRVTALDGNPRAAGLEAADEGLTVDIADEKAVLEALRSRKPDFLITGPIGRYLTTAGAVNDALGLPGISRQAAVLCTDKYLFHRKLQEKGLRNCHCYLLAAGEPISKDAYADLGFPAILKPRYGSGSRGIFFLEERAQLEEALPGLCAAGVPAGAGRKPQELIPEEDYVQELIPEEDYVLEEAVGGVEYGVDAAMDGERFCMILLRRKLLTAPPARQAVGYLSIAPGGSGADARLCERAEAYLSEVTALLGLKNCLLHADLMIGEDHIFAIELSARPSGHNLHNLFTPMATGVDMAGQYIRSRCGMACSYVPEKTEKLMIHYFDLEECLVKTVPEPGGLKLPEGIVLRAWHCTINPGDSMEKVSTGHSLMGRGYFILQAEEGLQQSADETEGMLKHAADGVLGQFDVERLYFKKKPEIFVENCL